MNSTSTRANEQKHLALDMKEPIIHLKNVHKTYLHGVEAHQALRGITLDVFHNEFVIIYGNSGGGKSSLLNIMGTIDNASRGEVVICGVPVKEKSNEDLLATVRLEKVGFVFQTFNLLSSMSAQENVELPMTLKAELSAPKRRHKAKAALERVGLGHRLSHFPNMLSGGEQQRVAIARATVNNPPLLLLDECTGDLDTANTNRIIALLLNMQQQQGITMVMVTHDTTLKHIADRVVYIRDGKVSRIEHVDELLKLRARSAYVNGTRSDIGHENDTQKVQVESTQDHVIKSSKIEVRGMQAYPFSEVMMK